MNAALLSFNPVVELGRLRAGFPFCNGCGLLFLVSIVIVRFYVIVSAWPLAASTVVGVFVGVASASPLSPRSLHLHEDSERG